MGFSPHHPVPDSEYLLARAEAEVALAMEARTEQAAEAHHRLASVYLDKLFGQPGASGPCDRRGPSAPSPATVTRQGDIAQGYVVHPGALPEDVRIAQLLDRLG
ncbi:MAG TPA: hypothetical protein VF649_05410 [Sphingomonas sp.]|jgi:hypothetical protein|uniref:hypothetical protein n=1 Tax=Sphingomonas sp. TaxID=28214 RepID=UPI002ED7A0FF